MDARQIKGLEIAAMSNITKKGAMWIVPSQSKSGRYGVTIDGGVKCCTCPDFELRQLPCKHIIAVDFVLQRETVTNGATTTVTETAAVRITYAQDWSAYNEAQTREKELFVKLFRDLCATVTDLPQAIGRPRLPRSEMLFSAGYKVYSGISARRFMTDLRKANQAGIIAHVPCYNSVLACLDDEALTPILENMVTQSALPLRALETDFAIDSTGFTSTQLVGSWQKEKYGSKAPRVEHDWLKVHAMVGCKTNAVVAIQIGARNSADCNYFAPLLEKTTDNFDVARILGDKAYSTYGDIALAGMLGAAPLIPFKSNAVGTGPSETWNKLFHFFSLHREDFLKLYHQRSNVESTFSAVKRKLGDFVRAKGKVAQTNELLLKFIAYNVTCVIHAMFEYGISPDLSRKAA
jgi:transposase